MKTTLLFVISMAMMFTLNAQEYEGTIERGNELILGTVSALGFQHIDFPRKNLIIKLGAVADFKALEGEKVVVDEVFSQNGEIKVVIKRKNGRKFFRFWPSVTASLEKALKEGELIFQKSKQKEAIAQI